MTRGRVDAVFAYILRRAAVGGFEDGIVVANVRSAGEAEAADEASTVVADDVAKHVECDAHIVILRGLMFIDSDSLCR